MLRAHQSHFCLRVIAEDPGFQSDVSDIQTETEQICQAELREWGNRPTCQRFPEGSCGNPGCQTPRAALRLPPTCAHMTTNLGKEMNYNVKNTDNVFNMHNVDKHKNVYSPSSAPIYSIQSPCKALHRPRLASNFGIDSGVPKAIRSQRLSRTISGIETGWSCAR